MLSVHVQGLVMRQDVQCSRVIPVLPHTPVCGDYHLDFSVHILLSLYFLPGGSIPFQEVNTLLSHCDIPCGFTFVSSEHGSEGSLNTPPQKMSLWPIDCFDLQAFGKQQME